jgi:hypothetical protein
MDAPDRPWHIARMANDPLDHYRIIPQSDQTFAVEVVRPSVLPQGSGVVEGDAIAIGFQTEDDARRWAEDKRAKRVSVLKAGIASVLATLAAKEAANDR